MQQKPLSNLIHKVINAKRNGRTVVVDTTDGDRQ